MEKRLRILKLSGLAVMEKEMIDVYSLAIRNVNVEELRQVLRKFQREHEERLAGLSGYVRRLRGQGAFCVEGMPEMHPGGLKPVIPDAGTAAALETLVEDETLVAGMYERAAGWRLGTEGAELLAGFRDQEDGHLRLLREAVRKKVWESFIVPVC